ncbi:Homer protein 3 [Cichlidogyrus casuarinus]|uniref:Homer protein 3 n=1 Tax=Cichlidogyrus casuarinus TaxID=1844966 RepID=A0ABD2QBR8_9PLAT
MGEPPIFTCLAQVFTIDPITKKTWKPSSTKSVDVNFFFDGAKKIYRIVSVEELEGSKKIVLNCTIGEKMVFKQTSQKFGQWADARSGCVYGLGFNSEIELKKFIGKFKSVVEDTIRIANSVSHKETAVTETGPLGPKLSLVSGNSRTGSLQMHSDDESSVAYKNVQAQIRRLEADLASTRLQASKLISPNGSETGKGSLQSDGGSGSWPIVPPMVYNHSSNQNFEELDNSRTVNGTRHFDEMKLREAISLQRRLGCILAEACELNNEISLLLTSQFA